MLEQVKLLSSRRAYEFRADDLRLSTLSVKPVQEHITKLFQFQAGLMATPMVTFGSIAPTYPPGFVFDMGVWISQEKQLVPIRFLHFEPTRIVIDVAGPSSAITAIFEQLEQIFSGQQAADGSPIIGKIERILEYSVISAKYSFALETLLAPPLRTFLTQTTKKTTLHGNGALASTFVLQMYPSGQLVEKMASPEDSNAFTFGLRVGTRPEEQVYQSSAPLDSEQHLQYLKKLDAALTSEATH